MSDDAKQAEAGRRGSAAWWESGWERSWYRADSEEKRHRTWIGYRFAQLRTTLQRRSPNTPAQPRRTGGEE